MLATLLHGMQGTPYIYQGEELGMTNVKYELEEYRDIELFGMYKERRAQGYTHEELMESIYAKTRDNARTPMQWDATENAGFTTGKPWLGINPNYTKINAENQKNDPHSIFSCYKALIALRKSSPALSRGDLEIPETGSDTLFALKRSYNGETLLSFHNFSAEPSKIPAALVPQNGEVLLSSYDREGGYIGPNLRPYESVIFRV